MLHERITIDPKIMFGKPVIKGTRVPVELLLWKPGEGMTDEQILDHHPQLTIEDIRAAAAFAADYLAPAGSAELKTNSFDAITVIIEGNGDTTIRPLRDSLKIWAAYERDRQANPTTLRPYRPYLEPPSTPPPDAGTTDRQ
jgi:uncharacterized protein (DUF433 family)